MAAHYDSEVQGRGRRFWFKTLRDAKAFDAAKRAAGYPTVRWERTVLGFIQQAHH